MCFTHRGATPGGRGPVLSRAAGGATMSTLIHYVSLDLIREQPEALVGECGEWRGGTDWSTKLEAVTCPRCRDRLLRSPHPVNDRRPRARSVGT